jgi:endo-1,4-beta-D-glucanase Y
MYKNSAIRNVKECANEWGKVYADGQAALAETQAKLRKIRRGIRWVKEQIKKGEPLPDSLRAWLCEQENASTHI